MIAVDTNVLIRFFVRDDAEQAVRATSMIRDEEIWVSKTVVLEAEWVLRSVYRYSSETVVEILKRLMGLPTVVLEDEVAVANALAWAKEGIEFADALHLASAGTSSRFATFDRKLAQQALCVTPLETFLL